MLDDRGPQAAVERGGKRELVARIDVELVGQRRRTAGRCGLVAQELVDGGQLAADASGLAARCLQANARPRAPRRGPPRTLDSATSRSARPASTRSRLALHRLPGLLAALLELAQLAGELELAVAVELRQLLLQRRRSAARPGVGPILGGGGAQSG